MNDGPRQTLRELVARHGPGLCSDARRCEALLRDHAGAHRREVNILVSALKERVPLDLLAGQSAVPREQLGIATSLGQFSRSIGGAVGVAMMGTVMTASLATLQGQGMPLARAMELSLHRAFIAGTIVSLVALAVAVKVPRGFPQRPQDPQQRPQETSSITTAASESSTV